MKRLSFMGDNMGTTWTFRRQAALLLLTAVATGGTATTSTAQADIPSIGMIKDYAARLVFDTVLGAADAQPLLVENGRRVGWAKIEPWRDAFLMDAARLAEGHILARIYSESGYTPLGLGRGANWWWVDKRGAGGRWRSIVYSEALKGGKITLFDSLISHPGYTWGQSIARFVAVDSTIMMWHGIQHGCVPSGPLLLAYLRLERADPWGTRRQQ